MNDDEFTKNLHRPAKVGDVRYLLVYFYALKQVHMKRSITKLLIIFISRKESSPKIQMVRMKIVIEVERI